MSVSQLRPAGTAALALAALPALLAAAATAAPASRVFDASGAVDAVNEVAPRPDEVPPAIRAQLDAWLIGEFRVCWRLDARRVDKDYVPAFRIRLSREGRLAEPPQLLNPRPDPADRTVVESVRAAVRRCMPLKVPGAFRPYYDRGYRERVIRFDPKEMS